MFYIPSDYCLEGLLFGGLTKEKNILKKINKKVKNHFLLT